MTTQTNDSLLDQSLVALQKMAARLRDAERVKTEAIAVVGLACRFPGGASTLTEYWQLLRDGADGIREVPPERWPSGLPQPDLSTPEYRGAKWAGLLDDVASFDAAFFGISPREAVSLDPQQRLTLEVAWEALEHAGIVPADLVGSNAGVFLGVAALDYRDRLVNLPVEELGTYAITGNLLSVAAGRLAYVLGLQGPCAVIDTACSSSLVATHLACQSLRLGECDLALSGGVNLLLSPLNMSMLGHARTLSSDGRCKTFDARADGLVRGEGCGMLVLKRLSSAERDGDRIFGILRGSAINQDGRSTGLTAPNVLSQQALLSMALRNAGLEPSQISLIEAHGTGTPLGDPIEAEALKAVHHAPRSDGSTCALGSVKANIGHLETASGVAGLIKVLLALRHEAIPRLVHFESLNPRISLEGTPLVIPEETLPWPRTEQPRRAGVSSFGISGTNAHVIVEEAPLAFEDDQPQPASQVIPISAKTPAALAALAAAWRRALAPGQELARASLAELAQTAALRRTHHDHRAALVVNDAAQLEADLELLAKGELEGLVCRQRLEVARPPIVFVFPGQGSQWQGMCLELLAANVAFRESMVVCDELIELETGWSLLGGLQGQAAAERLGEIEFVQVALFAIGVSLAAAWQAYGVVPDAVVGHSMGEIGAAHVAGILTLPDAVRLVCRRSRQLRKLVGHGAMGVVELPADRARAEIASCAGTVAFAGSNSPELTVLSGELDALETLMAAWQQRGIFCRVVRGTVPSHGPKVEPLLNELAAQLAELEPRAGRLPFYSSVLGERCAGTECGVSYWQRNLREPVLFSATIAALERDGFRVFLEMSPHPILTSAVEASLLQNRAQSVVLASLKRGEPELRTLLRSLGSVYCAGYPLDWRRLDPIKRALAPLPTYAWQRERYWLEPLAHQALEAKPTLSTLLGTPAAVGGKRVWNSESTSLPRHSARVALGFGAACASLAIELAFAAAEQAYPGRASELCEVQFEQATAAELGRGAPRSLTTSLSEATPGESRFGITCHAELALLTLARGSLRPRASASRELDEALRSSFQERANSSAAPASSREGESVSVSGSTRIEQTWQHEGRALAVLRPQDPNALGGFRLAPASLEAALALLAGLAGLSECSIEGVASVRMHGSSSAASWLTAELSTPHSADRAIGKVSVYDATGQLLLELEGVALRPSATRAAVSRDPELFYDVAWQPAACKAPRDTKPGNWLLLQGEGEFASAIHAAMEQAGHGVTSLTLGHASALDPSLPESFEAALREHFGASRSCDGIALLWPSELIFDESAADPHRDAVRLGVASLLHLVQAIGKLGWRDAPRLCIVTRHAQAVGDDDDVSGLFQAPLWGMAQTIAYEHSELRPLRIDLGSHSPDMVTALARELSAFDAEEQVALRSEGRFVARLVQREPEGALGNRLECHEGRAVSLELDPSSLRAELRAARGVELGPEELALSLESLSITSSEALWLTREAHSFAETAASAQPWCGAFAGRVVAAHPDCSLHVGDAVVGLTMTSVRSPLVVPASRLLKVPANVSIADVATTTLVHVIALEALLTLGRLGAGERVFIGGANRALGRAAIQWATRVGARVAALATTDADATRLRAAGVEFVSQAELLNAVSDLSGWASTGFDLIFGLEDPAFCETAQRLLGPGGRLVLLPGAGEARTAFSFAGLRAGRSLAFLDLRALCQEQPARVASLLARVTELVGSGELPTVAASCAPLSNLASHFASLCTAPAGAVLSARLTPHERMLVSSSSGLLRSDATYLITGGLGGLGLAHAEWLVDNGARSLVLLGRRDASSAAQREVLARLRSHGAQVITATCDVSNLDELRQVLARTTAQSAPLRGVFHAAGALDDGLLVGLTRHSLHNVMDAKVAGAWNLHVLTRELPLDLFVLYSSGSALVGSPGQANYAGANAFLDALARYRRARGLPALSIAWGAFADVGLAAASSNRGARLEHRGMGSLTVVKGNAQLASILYATSAYVAVMPFNPRQWVEFYPQVAGSPYLSDLFAKSQQLESPPSALFRTELEQLNPAQRSAALREFVRKQVAVVLHQSPSRLDEHAPFRSIGFDSLTGLELRNRMEAQLSVKLPASLIWTYTNIAALAEGLSSRIWGDAADHALETPSEAVQTDVRILRLSDDELMARLQREVQA